MDKYNPRDCVDALVGETWEPGAVVAETDAPDCYRVLLWDRAGTIIFHARHLRKREG